MLSVSSSSLVSVSSAPSSTSAADAISSSAQHAGVSASNAGPRLDPGDICRRVYKSPVMFHCHFHKKMRRSSGVDSGSDTMSEARTTPEGSIVTTGSILLDRGHRTSERFDSYTVSISFPQIKTPASSDAMLTNLPDAVFANILFDGYLDTSTILHTLHNINRKIRTLGYATVRCLNLQNFRVGQKHFANISANYFHLTSLTLNYCRSFDDEGLNRLRPLGATLRVLRLRGTSVTDQGLEALPHFPQLTSLDLSKTSRDQRHSITDRTVEILAAGCPQLRALGLGWCSAITDGSGPHLRRLARLQRLDLSLTAVTSRCCAHIGGLYLEHLDLSATVVCDGGVRLLARPPIDLPGAHSDQSDAPTALKCDARLLCSSSSRVESAAACAPSCALKVLRLRFASGITIAALQSLDFYAHRLQTLDLTHCPQLDFTQREQEKARQSMINKGTVVIKDIHDVAKLGVSERLLEIKI